MVKITFIGIILFTCLSCNFRSDRGDEQLLAEEDYEPPYSMKEQSYFDSLKFETGFDVSRSRTCIRAKGDKQMYYSVRLWKANTEIDSSNVKQLEELRDQIFIDLYSRILEDSVVCDLSNLSVNYSSRMSQNRDIEKSFITIQSYSIDDLLLHFDKRIPKRKLNCR